MEILDFLRKDYPMYAWSLRSLARRMQYFGIQFSDHDVEVNDVEAAVEKEVSGPGNCCILCLAPGNRNVFCSMAHLGRKLFFL